MGVHFLFACGSVAQEVDAFRKHCLINGLDDIGLTLQKVEYITAFEKSRSIKTPWLDGAGYVPK